MENCGLCEEGWQKALKKLAAYENTGLEPEDIIPALAPAGTKSPPRDGAGERNAY